MSDNRRQSDDERRQREEALAESLRIAAYADGCIKLDQANHWLTGPARYERHFIGYGEDRQPIYEQVRIT